MITWIFYAIANLVFMIIAYLTNPIVVLFADEYGNLPSVFRLWGTPDNCMDIEWMISEKQVLPIFRYDFNKHYVYHEEHDTDIGYVDLIDPHFTTIERIQRYFCRVAWLCRNNGYGFATEVCGRLYDPAKNIPIRHYHYHDDDELWISYIDDNKSWWNRTWCIYFTKPWCKWCYVRIYAGWKLKGDTTGPLYTAMLAFHFTFTRLRKYAE